MGVSEHYSEIYSSPDALKFVTRLKNSQEVRVRAPDDPAPARGATVKPSHLVFDGFAIAIDSPVMLNPDLFPLADPQRWNGFTGEIQLEPTESGVRIRQGGNHSSLQNLLLNGSPVDQSAVAHAGDEFQVNQQRFLLIRVEDGS